MTINARTFSLNIVPSGDGKRYSQYPNGNAPGGSFSHGDSVEITGSGFGTNSATLNFIGGDGEAIEAATLGARPSKLNWSFDSAWADALAYSDATRGQVLKCAVTEAAWNGDIRFDYGSAIAENTQYYWTWWAKADVSNIGSDDAQWKLARASYVNDVSDGDCEIVLFNWFNADKQLIVRRGGGDNSSPGYNPSDSHYPGRDLVWCRMELFVDTGTQGTADGTIYLVTQRAGSARQQMDLTSEKVYANANRHRYFILQNYWGNMTSGQATQDTYIDDVAVSVGSWKRVELTDHTTLAGSSFREFQPWTAWDDGSVTVKLNAGARAAGTYYLHVVSGTNTSLGYRGIDLV